MLKNIGRSAVTIICLRKALERSNANVVMDRFDGTGVVLDIGHAQEWHLAYKISVGILVMVI